MRGSESPATLAGVSVSGGWGMAKHQESADDSEGDGKTELDENELAELLKEPKGQHSADDDEEQQ